MEFLFLYFSFSCLFSHFSSSRAFTFLRNKKFCMIPWVANLKFWATGPIRALGSCLWNSHSGGKLHIQRVATEKYPRVIMHILALWLANDRFQAITVKEIAHYAGISKLARANQTSIVNQNARKQINFEGRAELFQ